MGDNEETTDALRAVKFVKGSDSIIEGLAIPFGGPAYLGGKDFDGERFVPETDFHFEWFPTEGRPFLINHGQDPEIKAEVVGRQVERTPMDAGHWVKVQLDKRARYFDHVQQLVDAGGMSFSSGAVSHLVHTEPDGTIKSWPWVELSGTSTPANPDAVAYAVKAVDLVDHFATAGLDVPAELIASALRALDDRDNDDSLPDGLKFAEHADRLLADVEAFRTRTGSLVELRGKSGRYLSQTTRERLLRHPAALRELADEIDGLASVVEEAKSADLSSLSLDYQRSLARLLGVELPAVGEIQ